MGVVRETGGCIYTNLGFSELEQVDGRICLMVNAAGTVRISEEVIMRRRLQTVSHQSFGGLWELMLQHTALSLWAIL